MLAMSKLKSGTRKRWGMRDAMRELAKSIRLLAEAINNYTAHAYPEITVKRGEAVLSRANYEADEAAKELREAFPQTTFSRKKRQN
jgi:IS5 family transposase